MKHEHSAAVYSFGFKSWPIMGGRCVTGPFSSHISMALQYRCFLLISTHPEIYLAILVFKLNCIFCSFKRQLSPSLDKVKIRLDTSHSSLKLQLNLATNDYEFDRFDITSQVERLRRKCSVYEKIICVDYLHATQFNLNITWMDDF